MDRFAQEACRALQYAFRRRPRGKTRRTSGISACISPLRNSNPKPEFPADSFERTRNWHGDTLPNACPPPTILFEKWNPPIFLPGGGKTGGGDIIPADVPGINRGAGVGGCFRDQVSRGQIALGRFPVSVAKRPTRLAYGHSMTFFQT